MHQKLWGYKVEEKIYLGVGKGERLNIAVLEDVPLNKRSFMYSQHYGAFYFSRDFP